MKKYIKPEYEVELFESGDIICYSAGVNTLGNYQNAGIGGNGITVTDNGSGNVDVGVDASDLF